MPETAPVASVIVDALLDPHFIAGLVAGCTVLGIGLAIASLSPRGGVALYGGTLLAIGTTCALLVTGSVSIWIVPGIVALGLAGALHRGLFPGVLLCIPGAILVLAAIPGATSTWMRWFAVAAIVTTAPLIASFDRRATHTGVPLPMFAISTLGLYLTIPDTEPALVLLGSASVVGFLGWPKPMASLGSAGSYAAAGIYAAVALTGAVGRPASLIAAEACLGLLVVAPVWWLSRSGRTIGFLERFDPTAVLLGQAAVVLITSRVLGRFSSPVTTILAVGAMLATTMLILRAMQLGPSSGDGEREKNPAQEL